jgi:hypothetical protein
MFKVRKRIKGLLMVIVDVGKRMIVINKRLIIDNSMPFEYFLKKISIQER